MEFKDDSGYAGARLKVKQPSPLNAEPSCPAELTESWITPPELAFQRNHGEILHYDRHAFRLVLRIHDEVASRVGPREMRLGLDDLRDQRWPTTRVVAALQVRSRNLTREPGLTILQCAGNRRDEMSERGGKTEGLGWGNAVVSNARWEGYLLRPLLLSLLSLPDSTDASTLPAPLRDAHVEFESDQPCQDDDTYGSSIPLVEAMSVAPAPPS